MKIANRYIKHENCRHIYIKHGNYKQINKTW